MSLPELPPSIRSLTRADKLRLIQLLAADMAREDGIEREVSDQTVPIWSPHEAFQGAATLLRAIDQPRSGLTSQPGVAQRPPGTRSRQ